MYSQIKSTVASGGGEAVLYSVLLGMLLSDITPTPADALYFNTEFNLKKAIEEGKITASQYWWRDAIAYYGYNSIWWGLVIGATVAIPGGLNAKVKMAVGLIAGGAVFGVLAKNIKKDKLRYS